MAEGVAVMLFAAGMVLLVSGAIIQFNSRSPYRNTPMDQKARNRYRVGAWMAAAGGACGLAIQLIGFLR